MLRLPQTSDTHIAQAARLAPWACAAYGECCSQEEVRLLVHELEGSLTRFDAYHAHGIIGQCGGVIIIAIAGSDDPADWRSNLDRAPYPLSKFAADHEVAIPEPAESLVLHTGFLQQAFNVRLALRDQLHPRFLCHQPVWIVGHSLGGAVASILPMIWPALFRPHVVTFGAPRVIHRHSPVNVPMAELYASFQRYVSIDDLVPQMPYGFGHVDSNARILRGPGEFRTQLDWRDLAWRAVRRLMNWRKPVTASRAAHECSLYTNWLEIAR